jgi:hypothetical protein
MVKDIARRIAALYPTAKFGPTGSVAVYSRDGVESIGTWDNSLGPRPTDAQLLAVDLLPDIKAVRCEAIDARTQALIASGFTFAGHVFSLSTEAQLNWTALYAARDSLTYPLSVTTDDDEEFSAPDAASLAGLCLTALASVKGRVDSGRGLKLAVLAAADAAALNAILDVR